MSFDTVSQTSDYSSGSEKSSTRPTVIPLYRTHVLNSYPCSERNSAPNRTSHAPADVALNSYTHQSRISRNHTQGKLGYQQQNCTEMNLKPAPNGIDIHSNALNSQLKGLVCENAMLKKEVKVLHDKCHKIELCERQFASLHTQYQEFVKTSSNRQALERQLRLQLEDDLNEALKAKSKMNLPQVTISNFSQTEEIVGIPHNEGSNREQQLSMEVSALRLMLREKEELILSLLSERNSKSTAFCPEDYDDDYIASNIVSL